MENLTTQSRLRIPGLFGFHVDRSIDDAVESQNFEHMSCVLSVYVHTSYAAGRLQ